MDPSALEYRRQRGLEKKDEQMAILVQRVSGSYYGKLYMPCAAGVGYSYSTYQWRRDIDPDAGMLRLVMGLGTKAVDRTQNDYPRLVNLDRPAVTMTKNVAEKHRFSQHKLDVLDLEENALCEKELDAVLPVLPRWLKNLLLEHDYEAEQRLYDMGRPRQIWFISCQRLLENEAFTGLMKKLLATLQRVYENPVDIEYTVNCGENGDFLVNLLQCRPLYVGQNREAVRIPALKAERTFFDIHDTCMGRSSCRKLDALVLVDPKEYYEYPYARKSEVAGVIGRINRYFLSQPEKKNVLLAVPGRIGTSSPELGIPAAFAELSGYCGICEVSDDRAGYMPELSFGSHMFQDLVEADIFYAAIYAEQKGLEKIDVQITYCQMESEEIRRFVQSFETEELIRWFYELIGKYEKWARFEIEWKKVRNASIHETEFPFSYRAGQRDMAAAVYRTILRKKKLFIQASTGVGKTISTVFPSVKALGEGIGEKIFYLTAKTITRTVAEQAFRTLSDNGLLIKVT